MVLSFLAIFFGIRTYRQNVGGGAITFGRAFKVGILITLVTCAIYVIGWEIVYWGFIPDFGDTYAAHVLEKLRAEGASAERLAAENEEDGVVPGALQEPVLQRRDHVPRDLPGGARRDARLGRDPPPEGAVSGLLRQETPAAA